MRCQRVAAANPPEQAADGWDLAAPMANRFLHIDHTPATDDWIDGMTTGFRVAASGRVLDYSPILRAASRAEVASFIRTRPDLLHALPQDDAASGRAWPSHRTWTMTADVLAFLDPGDTPATLLAASGLVGEGAATEYIAWRSLNDLPDPADVLADPESVSWATLEPSRAWATLTAVTMPTEEDLWDASARGDASDVMRILGSKPATSVINWKNSRMCNVRRSGCGCRYRIRIGSEFTFGV